MLKKEIKQPYNEFAKYLHDQTIIGKGIFTGETITTERMEGLPPYEQATVPNLHPDAVSQVLKEDKVEDVERVIFRYIHEHPDAQITLDGVRKSMKQWAARHRQIAEGTEMIVDRGSL